MGNSIRTTSNTQNTPTTAHTAPLFAAGDAILCPFVGTSVYQLFTDTDSGLLSFRADDGVLYHTRDDGKQRASDPAPTIFHDSPAPVARTHHINAVSAIGCDEVVTLSSIDLSDIASDLSSAISAFNDLGHLLGLIYRNELSATQAAAMARLAHDSTATWAGVLSAQLEQINEPLGLSRFGKVEV